MKMAKLNIMHIVLIVLTTLTLQLTTTALAQTELVFQKRILVTTTKDELNSFIANDTCSLREAIILANKALKTTEFGGCKHDDLTIGVPVPTDESRDFPKRIIILDEGIYQLTRKNISLPHLTADTGNLNISKNVQIRGEGPRKTIIDGSGIANYDKFGGVISISADHIIRPPLAIPPLESTLTKTIISNLTIRNGEVQPVFQGDDPPKGSAIFNNRNYLVLDNVTIENSSPRFPAIYVGGFYRISFLNSLCTGNIAGCIEKEGFGDVAIEKSVFHDNGVAIKFAGSSNNNSKLSIENSLFTQNKRAIDATFPELLTIYFTTITDNTPDEGSAVEIRAEGETVRVFNSIIAGNFSGSEERNCDDFRMVSDGYNLVGSDCRGFTATGDQINTSSLRLNGSFAPNVGSSALDKGFPNCTLEDVYGNSRPIDGDGDGQAVCDIGAVEQQSQSAPQADLALSLNSGPNGYFRGVAIEQIIELKNNGPLLANEMLVQISLPADASNISSSYPNCSVRQGRVPFLSCIVDTLAVNEAQLLPYTFTIAEDRGAEVIQVSAQVRGTVNDSVTTNNALDITLVPLDIAVAPTPSGSDFALTITESVDPVTEGELLGYILKVTNLGPTVGKATLAVSYTEGTNPPTTCQAQNEKAECTIAALEVNESKQFLFSIKADKRTTPFIEATIKATDDPELSNNSKKQKTEVQAIPTSSENGSDVTVSITGSSSLQANSEALYEISIQNLSSTTAKNSQAVIRLSDGLKFVERTFGCTDVASEITCSFGNIPALANKSVNVKVAALSNSGTESIAVEIDSDIDDPDPSNNSDNKSVEVVTQPTTNLAFSVSDSQLERRSVAVGESNTNVLQFQATGERASLTALNLKARGTGQDATDLQSIKLWQDSNVNGLVDDGDVQLAQGNFAADDGALRLELTQPLNLSQPASLLVTVDVNSSLALNLFNLGLLMTFGLFGFGIIKRVSRNTNASRALNILLILSLLALVGCGGSTTKTPVTPPNQPNQPIQPNQPNQPVISRQVSFQLTLESAEAIVPSSNTLNIIGLPITGTELTVSQ